MMNKDIGELPQCEVTIAPLVGAVPSGRGRTDGLFGFVVQYENGSLVTDVPPTGHLNTAMGKVDPMLALRNENIQHQNEVASKASYKAYVRAACMWRQHERMLERMFGLPYGWMEGCTVESLDICEVDINATLHRSAVKGVWITIVTSSSYQKLAACCEEANISSTDIKVFNPVKGKRTYYVRAWV